MWVDQYRETWKKFADELTNQNKDLGELAKDRSGYKMHELLRECYWIPYKFLHNVIEYPKIDTGSMNIGSATGLFFEQLVVSFVVPYFQTRFPEIQFSRNSAISDSARSIARDPDLHMILGNVQAVLEIKVAPKKRDVEWLLELKSRYNQVGIYYFVIGGYAGINAEMLNKLASENWISFLDASKKNKPLLANLTPTDDVLKEVSDYFSIT